MMKRSCFLKVFVFFIAAVILTVSIVTLVHAKDFGLCHKVCVTEHPKIFSDYLRCMKACIQAPEE